MQKLVALNFRSGFGIYDVPPIGVWGDKRPRLFEGVEAAHEVVPSPAGVVTIAQKQQIFLHVIFPIAEVSERQTDLRR
jgi:hypothetical protein